MRVVFAGTPAFAVPYLQALQASNHEVAVVITQPDQPGKRGRKPVPGPVKVAAMSSNVPVRQPARVKAGDLCDVAADVMIVVAYGQILGLDVLTLPRYGCINVHGSLLPRWRGAAPIQRAILAGDQTTGVCIMRMEEGLDTGPVFTREPVRIDPSDTTGTLIEKLNKVGPGALLHTLDALETESAVAVAQPGEGVTYATKIDKEEARINWELSAETINRAVRAFNPDPIAFTLFDNMRLKVWAAAPDPGPVTANPGTILELTSQGIRVACGEGSLTLTKLQLPIGKGSVQTGRDILNSRRELFAPGARFI
ncbi:MAG: methionyl-tRNA formyltransferase [Proteobacteria bacterium]|jgi:methionyl-tRNA formyltransferase|nr:methionyl-tRNA formyltransferase [Pseudomonadota bacterium]